MGAKCRHSLLNHVVLVRRLNWFWEALPRSVEKAL